MDEHLTFEELSRRLDGEVSPSRREQIDEHLARCEACRKEYETLRWIEEVASDLDWPEPPPGFTMSLPASLRGEAYAVSSLRAARRWLMRPAVLAFGAAAAALLFLAFGRSYCLSPTSGNLCPTSLRVALGGEAVIPLATPEEIVVELPHQPGFELPGAPRDVRTAVAAEPATEPVVRGTAFTLAATVTPTASIHRDDGQDEDERSRAIVRALVTAGVPEPESAATQLAAGKMFQKDPGVLMALQTAEAELTATAELTSTATITATREPREEPTREPYPPPPTSTTEPYPPPDASSTPSGYPGPEALAPNAQSRPEPGPRGQRIG